MWLNVVKFVEKQPDKGYLSSAVWKNSVLICGYAALSDGVCMPSCWTSTYRSESYDCGSAAFRSYSAPASCEKISVLILRS